jgi:hypothetical protein
MAMLASNQKAPSFVCHCSEKCKHAGKQSPFAIPLFHLLSSYSPTAACALHPDALHSGQLLGAALPSLAQTGLHVD